MPYSTITYWCRKLKLKDGILVIRMALGRPPEVDLDNAILDALNEFPFHGLSSLSRVLKRFLSTIRDNASPHRSTEMFTDMKEFFFRRCRIPQFYLFGTIEGRLTGRTFQDAWELLEAINEGTCSIRSMELDAVFLNGEDPFEDVLN
jgi:hypothetical protein